MEFFMSIVDIANGRLLASVFERLARLYRDLARKAEDRRITREVANDLSLLSG
jgi:hypothetical protein